MESSPACALLGAQESLDETQKAASRGNASISGISLTYRAVCARTADLPILLQTLFHDIGKQQPLRRLDPLCKHYAPSTEICWRPCDLYSVRSRLFRISDNVKHPPLIILAIFHIEYSCHLLRTDQCVSIDLSHFTTTSHIFSRKGPGDQIANFGPAFGIIPEALPFSIAIDATLASAKIVEIKQSTSDLHECWPDIAGCCFWSTNRVIHLDQVLCRSRHSLCCMCKAHILSRAYKAVPTRIITVSKGASPASLSITGIYFLQCCSATAMSVILVMPPDLLSWDKVFWSSQLPRNLKLEGDR